MKKVLILAYDFPPYVSVGGLRPYNWFKYLHEFGVYPVVITRQWENEFGNHLDYVSGSRSSSILTEMYEYGTIIKTPYKPNWSNRMLMKYGESKFIFLRKVVTAYFEFAQFFLPVGSKVELVKAARVYLSENKVDAILATGDPFVLFSYADKLSKEFSIPWIADYRDPWSENRAYSFNTILKVIHRKLEKNIVKSAHTITTVDELFKDKIGTVIKNKNISVLPNGFDPEVVRKANIVKQSSNKLQIALVGTILAWHPLEVFLDNFKTVVLNNHQQNVQLNIIGASNVDFYMKLIDEKYSEIKSNIVFYPKMPNDLLLQFIGECNLMLLFNYYSYTGTKIYDYLAIRRKIIFCFENDERAEKLKKQFYNIDDKGYEREAQADLIRSTNSGVIVRDGNQLVTVLQALLIEFQETGQIACNSIGVEKYSRKIQVEKLAEIIKEL